jgi:CheY-like chemotaxis protein
VDGFRRAGEMMRILVIDDDGDILEIISEMLTDAGYEVQEANSGSKGIKLYRQAPFDLVITDLIMPEKDGLEVVMELHKDFPDVKIITLSGNAYGRSSLETSRALGAARTLGKPFTEAELLEAVRQVLDSK